MKITDKNITRDHQWSWFIEYTENIVADMFGTDAAESVSKRGGTLAWEKCEQSFYRYEERTRYDGHTSPTLRGVSGVIGLALSLNDDDLFFHGACVLWGPGGPRLSQSVMIYP